MIDQTQVRDTIAATLTQPPPARRRRLTDPQSGFIEGTAVNGGRASAPNYAQFGGDAAKRATADALVRHGLLTEVGNDEDGYRRLELTPQGWRTYWHHRLIIRRLPDEQHAATCPCAGSSEPYRR